MSKESEAFSRMSNMLSEYEDFIYELPYCPEWETEYNSSDEQTVSVALEEKEKQDEILKILKNKKVQLYNLMYYIEHKANPRKFYNDMFGDKDDMFLTEEEYNLIKQWLEDKND